MVGVDGPALECADALLHAPTLIQSVRVNGHLRPRPPQAQQRFVSCAIAGARVARQQHEVGAQTGGAEWRTARWSSQVVQSAPSCVCEGGSE